MLTMPIAHNVALLVMPINSLMSQMASAKLLLWAMTGTNSYFDGFASSFASLC